MIDGELYWYDNLKDAAADCKQTGNPHTFTSDEVEAILECLEIWEERADEREEHAAKLRAELARRDEVIARLKEVLPTLKRSHYYCEDCWYSCPLAEDGCCDEGAGDKCNCGAEEYNAKIDALMKELEEER